MTEKIDNLLALIQARNEFILETEDEVKDTEIFKQTLKNIDTIIAQRGSEICSEFKKNNFVEQATETPNVNH